MQHEPLRIAHVGIPYTAQDWEHERFLPHVSRRCSGWSIENGADVANCVGMDGMEEYVTALRKRSPLHLDKLEERHRHSLLTRRRMMEQADVVSRSLTRASSCGSTMRNHHGTEDGETVAAAAVPWVHLEPVIIKSADIRPKLANHKIVQPVVQTTVATNVRILLAATSSSIVTSAMDELSSFQTLMNITGADTTNADELVRNTNNIVFCDRESRASDVRTKRNYYPNILNEMQHPFYLNDVSSCLPVKFLTHFHEEQYGHRNTKCVTSQENFGATDISERKTATISEINPTVEAESTESCSYSAYINAQIKQVERTAKDRGCKSRAQQGSPTRASYTNRSKSEQSCNTSLLDLAALRSTVSALGEINGSTARQPHPHPAPAIDLTLKLA